MSSSAVVIVVATIRFLVVIAIGPVVRAVIIEPEPCALPESMTAMAISIMMPVASAVASGDQSHRLAISCLKSIQIKTRRSCVDDLAVGVGKCIGVG